MSTNYVDMTLPKQRAGDFFHPAINPGGDPADPETMPSVKGDAPASMRTPYRALNSQAYDLPGYQERLNAGVDSQSSLMGGQGDEDAQSSALSARASQYYKSSLNQLARSSVPESIAATTKLQTQDINNRAAIYSDIQTRAQINYKETLMRREQALGVAIMQRDLYGSLFGGFAKLGGSVAAAALSSSKDQTASANYYSSQLQQPEFGSSSPFATDSVPQGPDLGMNTNYSFTD